MHLPDFGRFVLDDQSEFGLYVHWPWCQAKCPYCDFNSHVTARIDQDQWAQAYVDEITHWGARTGPRLLHSVFFGGGTPSLMAPGVVERVLQAAGSAWTFANDIEITLEANPTSVEAGKFRDFRLAGVNRVSVGVQALRDQDLQRLGRLHSVAEGLRAVEVAQATFDRVNADLIYARQDQSLEDWEAELTQALSLGLRHLSLYQLTIEEGTPFAARHKAGGLRGLPGEDLAADMFDLTRQMTARAGLPAYEVSNHAVPGEASRHNLIYWNSGDWAGVGPGAHGRVTLGGQRWATVSHRAPDRWLASAGGSRASEELALEAGAVLDELVLMGLRTTQGVRLDVLRDFGGARVIERAASLEALGMLQLTAERMRVTEQGMAVLNAVIAKLLD
jgi:putative oxygen-independent coproporphyrinogen III oxidase